MSVFSKENPNILTTSWIRSTVIKPVKDLQDKVMQVEQHVPNKSPFFAVKPLFAKFLSTAENSLKQEPTLSSLNKGAVSTTGFYKEQISRENVQSNEQSSTILSS